MVSQQFFSSQFSCLISSIALVLMTSCGQPTKSSQVGVDSSPEPSAQEAKKDSFVCDIEAQEHAIFEAHQLDIELMNDGRVAPIKGTQNQSLPEFYYTYTTDNGLRYIGRAYVSSDCQGQLYDQALATNMNCDAKSKAAPGELTIGCMVSPTLAKAIISILHIESEPYFTMTGSGDIRGRPNLSTILFTFLAKDGIRHIGKFTLNYQTQEYSEFVEEAAVGIDLQP